MEIKGKMLQMGIPTNISDSDVSRVYQEVGALGQSGSASFVTGSDGDTKAKGHAEVDGGSTTSATNGGCAGTGDQGHERGSHDIDAIVVSPQLSHHTHPLDRFKLRPDHEVLAAQVSIQYQNQGPLPIELRLAAHRRRTNCEQPESAPPWQAHAGTRYGRLGVKTLKAG